jgi:hypothetical protein
MQLDPPPPPAPPPVLPAPPVPPAPSVPLAPSLTKVAPPTPPAPPCVSVLALPPFPEVLPVPALPFWLASPPAPPKPDNPDEEPSLTPPPAATTSREFRLAKLPSEAQLDPHEIKRTSEAPPPPLPSEKILGVLTLPPVPPPLKPPFPPCIPLGSPPLPPTSTYSVEVLGGRVISADTTAPRPVVPPDALSPLLLPGAPTATTCSCVTPAGTVNVCSLPV